MASSACRAAAETAPTPWAVRRRDHLPDLVLRLPHADPHLLRGAGALLGELPHLVGHDAEAQAVLPRARRFDRRVQGEEVGLAGDPGDRVDELSDFSRAQLQRAGRAGHLIEVVAESHEQLARPRDLLAMALRLLRHAGSGA